MQKGYSTAVADQFSCSAKTVSRIQKRDRETVVAGSEVAEIKGRKKGNSGREGRKSEEIQKPYLQLLYIIVAQFVAYHLFWIYLNQLYRMRSRKVLFIDRALPSSYLRHQIIRSLDNAIAYYLSRNVQEI